MEKLFIIINELDNLFTELNQNDDAILFIFYNLFFVVISWNYYPTLSNKLLTTSLRIRKIYVSKFSQYIYNHRSSVEEILDNYVLEPQRAKHPKYYIFIYVEFFETCKLFNKNKIQIEGYLKKKKESVKQSLCFYNSVAFVT